MGGAPDLPSRDREGPYSREDSEVKGLYRRPSGSLRLYRPRPRPPTTAGSDDRIRGLASRSGGTAHREAIRGKYVACDGDRERSTWKVDDRCGMRRWRDSARDDRHYS